MKAGTGKNALVLIYGFGDTSRMWIPLFDEFGNDYTIIAPGMRGLGARKTCFARSADSGYRRYLAKGLYE